MKNARSVVFEILLEVLQNRKFSNVMLNKWRKQNAISESDMAFVVNVVYGTLEYQIYLEYTVNKLIDGAKTDRKIQIILWMGLYQLLFMNTPPYAVVNESVNLAKTQNERLSGLVNKVLKTFISKQSLLQVVEKDKVKKLCLEHAMPEWIYELLATDYDEQTAKRFIQNITVPKKASYRINTLKISSSQFYEQFNMEYEMTPSKIARDCFTTDLNLLHSRLFTSGFIYAQDQCSVLAGQIAAPLPNTTVLDMCCAPGGKLTHLAALMQNTGQLFGNELNASKKPLIAENLDRLGVTNCTILTKNVLTLDLELCDTILLDAPCSGLGVIKNKPEIRLRDEKEILSVDIISLQQQLLEKADTLLREGGTLVYSTCSVAKRENADQIGAFLAAHPNYEKQEEHQFFGFEYGTDGFYICKLKKAKS